MNAAARGIMRCMMRGRIGMGGWPGRIVGRLRGKHMDTDCILTARKVARAQKAKRERYIHSLPMLRDDAEGVALRQNTPFGFIAADTRKGT